jgi:hypothetical protein
MRGATRQNATGPMIRSWTYILISCALLLRKAEAADLRLGDVEVPLDKVSGQMLLVDGLPKYLFIHIRRSKTDQDGQGKLVHYWLWTRFDSSHSRPATLIEEKRKEF